MAVPGTLAHFQWQTMMEGLYPQQTLPGREYKVMDLITREAEVTGWPVRYKSLSDASRSMHMHSNQLLAAVGKLEQLGFITFVGDRSTGAVIFDQHPHRR